MRAKSSPCCGTPTTKARPPSMTMSSAEASSMWPAMRRILSLTLTDARTSAPPPVTALRLAKVLVP
jgi:hypothetical protein